MLQFTNTDGHDPFTTQSFGSGDDRLFTDVYFSAFPVNWRVQSNAHAILLNDAGRLIYGGAAIEYALNAYTKTYGQAHVEYILGGIVPLDLSGTLVGTSGFSLLAELNVAFASTFAATGTMQISKWVDVTMGSSGELATTFGLQYEISLVIAEVLEAVGGFGATGGQDAAPVWVFNAKTFAPSRYEGLEVRSLAKLGTTVYGAGPGGIYELAGSTDAGVNIAASFIVGREGYGVGNVKRMAYGYVHGTSEGVLQVRVIDDTGAVHTYETERALGNKIRSVRFKVGKGLKSHYWQFEVRNKLGQQFEVHHVDLLAAALERMTKG
ncbi:MAG: hypothetical protein ACREXU_00620 [Gammaproteobacteria bacterium]